MINRRDGGDGERGQRRKGEKVGGGGGGGEGRRKEGGGGMEQCFTAHSTG